jgi:hypothetical protein
MSPHVLFFLKSAKINIIFLMKNAFFIKIFGGNSIEHTLAKERLHHITVCKRWPIRISARLNFATICGPLKRFFMRGSLSKSEYYTIFVFYPLIRTGPVFGEQASLVIFLSLKYEKLIVVAKAKKPNWFISPIYTSYQIHLEPSRDFVVVFLKIILRHENMIFMPRFCAILVVMGWGYL